MGEATGGRQRILSGMRPTGRLHLGNLVGALANWRALQDDYDCFFMIADYHALMSEYESPAAISESTREVLIDFVSCGLDPRRSVLFRQSDVPGHAELHLVLSCYTPIGWLERCPTYKEQIQQLANKDIHNYAFLGYPVLQAADIAIYKAHLVPVGEDQLPHLELTREVVRRFNTLTGAEVLIEPQAKLTSSPRLLGTDRRKMSKSYGNQIDIADGPDTIRKKVRTMITDPKRIRRDDVGHPDECNVCDYHKTFAPDEAAEVAEKCRTAAWGCTDCKARLADILVEYLREPRQRRAELEADPQRLKAILADGAERAGAVADETLREVKRLTGLGGW
ncbi:MAG: tryptophan--tRNA ligase [Planctomycetes bacterium SM23_25]|nr:MAG: tryptophan--tRNA ligase [Planctomycetes bacterium SM23_25]